MRLRTQGQTIIAFAAVTGFVCSLIPSAPIGTTHKVMVIRTDPMSSVGTVSSGQSPAIVTTSSGACRMWRPLADFPQDHLTAMSATSLNDIWVAGSGTKGPGQTDPIIWHWDGKAWTQYDVALVQVPGLRVTGIAAVSPTDVWAAVTGIGLSSPRWFVDWNGQRWDYVPDAAPESMYASINALSAAASNDVWAVGDNGLIEHWDGTHWHLVDGDVFNLGQVGVFSAAASPALHDFWALGSTSIGYDVAAVAHWNGATWSRRVLTFKTVGNNLYQPAPAGEVIANEDVRLTAVSAVSRNDIWAVGSYTTGTSDAAWGAVIVHWNGEQWTSVPFQVTNFDTWLTSVAALSDRDVWMAGDGMAEHWDGQHWAMVALPASISALVAVSPTLLIALAAFADGGSGLYETIGHTCVLAHNTAHAIRDVGFASDNFPYYYPEILNRLAVDPQEHRLFVEDPDHPALDLIDTKTDRVVGNLPLPDTPGSLTLVPEAHRLYVPAGSSLVQISTITGHIISTLPTVQVAFEAVASPKRQRVAVLGYATDVRNYNAQLRIEDDRTGRTTSTIPLSNPMHMALDEATGHIFVASGNGLANVDISTGRLVSTAAYTDTKYLIDDPVHGAMIAVGETRDAQQSGYSLQLARFNTQTGALSGTVTLGHYPPQEPLLDTQVNRLVVPVQGDAHIVDTAAFTEVARVATGSSVEIEGIDTVHHRLIGISAGNFNHYGDPTGPGYVEWFDTLSGQALAIAKAGWDISEVAYDPTTDSVFLRQFHGMGVVSPSWPIPQRWPTPKTPLYSAGPKAMLFGKTHHSVDGVFLDYWRRHGGLTSIGYPRTEAYVQDAHWVQDFDNVRLVQIHGQVVAVRASYR